VGVARGWCAGRSDDWRTVRVSVFSDGAVVHNQVDPQPTPASIVSVGAALTWTPSSVLHARFTYARALIKAPITGAPDLQDRGVAFEVTIHPLSLFTRGRG